MTSKTTISVQELLLNAVALEFVLNIDELVYESCSPLRLKQLVDGLEAL